MNKRLMLILVMVLLGIVLVNKISEYQAQCYSEKSITTDNLQTGDDQFCGQSYMLVNTDNAPIHVHGVADKAIGEKPIDFTLEPGEMYPLNGDGVIDYQFEESATVKSTVVSELDSDLIVFPSEA